MSTPPQSTPLYMHTFGDIANSFLLPASILNKVTLHVTSDPSLPSFKDTILQIEEDRWVCRTPGCELAPARKGLCRVHGGLYACTYAGCTSAAQLNRLCSRHGGYRECSVKGCKNQSHARRLCRRHGNVRPKKCEEKNCTNQCRIRGRCASHDCFSKCLVEECFNQKQKQGLCGRHFRQHAHPRKRSLLMVPFAVTLPTIDD